ncbi:MAG TPA: hypothetical protein VH206_17160 [Xanthobacteraceae bacterium]|jgi:hypothetical protein|nr:hypothetical protein [Xanthobacteraceae bacterium]
MEFSVPAWIGALVATIIGVAIYVQALPAITQHLRAQQPLQTLEQRAAFNEKLSIIRRLILAADVTFFATTGYWLGKIIGAKWAV